MVLIISAIFTLIVICLLFSDYLLRRRIQSLEMRADDHDYVIEHRTEKIRQLEKRFNKLLGSLGLSITYIEPHEEKNYVYEDTVVGILPPNPEDESMERCGTCRPKHKKKAKVKRPSMHTTPGPNGYHTPLAERRARQRQHRGR